MPEVIMRALLGQLARFGAVGTLGLVIDVVVFNALRTTVFDPDVVAAGPVLAKVVSTSLAIAANWMGNRYWTFGAHRRSAVGREGLEFLLVSLGGMAISLACLWFSHYVLGYTSLLADNIAGNVVGLALGTAFRFTFYRNWVFHPRRSSGAAERAVGPAGVSPSHRIEAISPVDDRSLGHD